MPPETRVRQDFKVRYQYRIFWLLVRAGFTMQDKRKEIAFFDGFPDAEGYNVFSDEANRKLVDKFEALTRPSTNARLADLGCGSGVFTQLLANRGYMCVGLDLSRKLLQAGKRVHPDLRLVAGDVEKLPFASDSLDIILLSGIVHHLPDPSCCAREVYRALRRGGKFVAFDPNRRNPFMYLHRDRSSPFYCPIGVTENERPVLAEEVAQSFIDAGFRVWTDYLSGLAYRYVASSVARRLLPVYNVIDNLLFRPRFMMQWSAFVFTFGEKGA